MVMLNKVYSTFAADYRVRLEETGRYTAYVRPMLESWAFVGTFDTAEEAFKEAQRIAEEAEVMAQFDEPDYDFCY